MAQIRSLIDDIMNKLESKVVHNDGEIEAYKNFIDLIYKLRSCCQQMPNAMKIPILENLGAEVLNKGFNDMMIDRIRHDLDGTKDDAGKVLKVLLKLDESKINDDYIRITDWEKTKHFLGNMCRIIAFITIVIPLLVWGFQYRTYGEINWWLFDTAKESKEILQDAAVRFYKKNVKDESINTFADMEKLKQEKLIEQKSIKIKH